MGDIKQKPKVVEAVSAAAVAGAVSSTGPATLCVTGVWTLTVCKMDFGHCRLLALQCKCSCSLHEAVLHFAAI